MIGIMESVMVERLSSSQMRSDGTKFCEYSPEAELLAVGIKTEVFQIT